MLTGIPFPWLFACKACMADSVITCDAGSPLLTITWGDQTGTFVIGTDVYEQRDRAFVAVAAFVSGKAHGINEQSIPTPTLRLVHDPLGLDRDDVSEETNEGVTT